LYGDFLLYKKVVSALGDWALTVTFNSGFRESHVRVESYLTDEQVVTGAGNW